MKKKRNSTNKQTDTEIAEKIRDLYKEVKNDLTEIQFWKLFQPKDALKAFDESREMLRTVMDNIPQLIAWKDKNLDYMGCNTNFAHFIHIPDPNFIIGKQDKDLNLKIKILAEIEEIEKKIIKTKKSELHSIETWFDEEGNELFFDTNRVPLLNKKGKVIGLLISLEDITERLEADSKLKESEQKYRDLAELLPDMIYEADTNAKITYANPVAFEKLGYTQEDLDKGFYMFQLVNESYLRTARKNVLNFIKGKSTGPNEYLMKKSDGSTFFARVHSRGIVRDGKPVGLRGVVHDIQDLKDTENKLKESERKLKELNIELENKVRERTKELQESERKLKKQNIELKKIDSLKNDFISMAAHELKTPLISISGYTEYVLLKYGEKLNPEIKKDMEIVQKNIERLKMYMNQLLDVMKIDEHQLKLNNTLFNINNVIQDCINELSYLVREKEHKLKVELEGEILLIGDKERLFQVVSNLLSNSIKFTPKKGSIEITSKLENGNYLFEIKDSGIGLEEKELNTIFDKFESIPADLDENYSRNKGTGLGLYISRGIVESHGGKIHAESEGLNKGTKVQFSIPMEK